MAGAATTAGPDLMRRRLPRFSLGTLMVLVAMAGVNLAMLAAMRRRTMIDASTWGAAVLLLLCYDCSAYFTILAFRQAMAVRPAPGERPAPLAIGVAILVLGTCAGLAIVSLAMILSRPVVE